MRMPSTLSESRTAGKCVIFFVSLWTTTYAHAACFFTDARNIACDATPPSPWTVPVVLPSEVAGSVNIYSGAAIAVTKGGNGVLVSGNSNVINDGTISTDIDDNSFFDAISARGENNQITNNGTIITSGLRSEGFYTSGTNNTFLNYGDIMTSAELSAGAISDRGSSNNQFVNQGTVTTTGERSVGIEAFGDRHQIINTHQVTTSGDQSDGLKVDGSHSAILNSGMISVHGEEANGISVLGNHHDVMNTGTITTDGASAAAIFAFGDSSQIRNEGALSTTGNAAHGIFTNGNLINVSNQGNIVVRGEFAHGITSINSAEQQPGKVVNEGNITAEGAGGTGIWVLSATNVTNQPGTQIHSLQGRGIDFISGGTLLNAGNILAENADGVHLGGDSQVNTTSGSLISGVTALTGSSGFLRLINDGRLAGTAGLAIHFEGNSGSEILNTGTITGSTGSAILTGNGNDLVSQMDGIIHGNIELNDGMNEIRMTGGQVQGTMLTGAMNDNVFLSAGTLDGDIKTGGGDDLFTWEQHAIINGNVDLGHGEDSALLSGLSRTQTDRIGQINGAAGNDNLQIHSSSFSNPVRLTGWERIGLNNGSSLILDTPLILGEPATSGGRLDIDASSRLQEGGINHMEIRSAEDSGQVEVFNAGIIDLTGESAEDTLTIHGDYTGEEGSIQLQTVLGNENSPTDRLIVDGGHASGSTTLNVVNLNGGGAYTAGNGIELVSAANQATTTQQSFRLSGEVCL